MKLITTGILENISTRNDGSIKFTIGCQEMESSQAGNLFQLRGKYIKTLLSDTNISPIEEKLVDEENIAGAKKAKSPSQRLRSVMFKLHEASKIPTEFETWYKGEMESLINKYKEALNEYA